MPGQRARPVREAARRNPPVETLAGRSGSTSLMVSGRWVYLVCPGSCDGLAGESPAGVVAKRPRSWWPAEGEIRLSKRHDKVAVGGEQVVGPYERNPVTAS